MAENYVLLETIDLTQSAASVTFDNIPQSGYTDLKLFVSTRTDTITGAWDNVYITFNGSSSGYSQRILYGNGSIAQSDTGSSTYIRTVYSNTATQGSNYFSSNEICIPNYTSSNYKTASMESAVEQNGTNGHLSIASALWTNTSAITSITLAPSAYTFAAGCTFSLYGLAAVGTTPTVAPKATGGNIVANDGTYWYHAFLSSGTFTPQTPLTCDVLVVAGGGGSGIGQSGGGGAGGVLAHTSQSLTASNYTVLVGGGGNGTTTVGTSDASYNGTSGSNSQFGSLTASIGGGFGAGAAMGASANGGSGGGANWNAGYVAGTGTSGQGFAGGNPSGNFGGGGGGAGEAGNTDSAGYGGDGTNSYSTWASATGTGVSGYYAGGGAGGKVNNDSTVLLGGDGGGGNSAGAFGSTPGFGVANTGSGGGGGVGRYPTSPYHSGGGAGGSGIIIIRYAM